MLFLESEVILSSISAMMLDADCLSKLNTEDLTSGDDDLDIDLRDVVFGDT